MKDWKALILKITLLVLVGIVMLTGWKDGIEKKLIFAVALNLSMVQTVWLKRGFVGNKQVTDLSYLREVAMGDEEIVIETAEAFLDDAPEAVQNMQDRFANQEWEKLYKQAHKIKPSLKYMGMDRATELILEIEGQAKSGNISEKLGSQIKEFNSLCQQALQELSDEIENLKSAES